MIGYKRVGMLLIILFLSLTIIMPTANAALEFENAKSWYWTGDTDIESTVTADVDGDGNVEIVTAGYFADGSRDVAQLVVLNGDTMAVENVQAWYWYDDTYIWSVAAGDVDGDGNVEIVTGGNYNDGNRDVAQLCVWNGALLTLENVKTWYWSSDTIIDSVAIGDVDGDGKQEIVTGGDFYDGRDNAQVCVWNGATLALENVKTWYWTGNTTIDSVAIGDVDGDGNQEIITGGYYWDGLRNVAQLCVWNGATLALENVKTWFWGRAYIYSVAIGDVDGDGKQEICTGGYYFEGSPNHVTAQLCVWNGATLALENIQCWYWTNDTFIDQVVIGNVDGDANMEIVTGGTYFDGGHFYSMLCVWNGGTLSLEEVKAWYWTGDTEICSTATSDVDGDSNVEIVTGGYYYDGVRYVAQVCVWS